MRLRAAFVLVASTLAVTCATGSADGPGYFANRGAELYARHCAVCHGSTGDADTAVAALLRPRPLPFRDGLFKLVSTENGVPTEDDLVRTLYYGMPGSTMMAYSWLPRADLEALAREVRRLAIAGRASWIQVGGEIARRPVPRAAALARAEAEMTPGAVVEIGAAIHSPSKEDLAAGRELFMQYCASCHSADGRGLQQATRWQNGAADWILPRDFTVGYLRGDVSHRELAYRIRAGMPAALMMPAPIAVAETAKLVAYVRSLVPEGSGDRHTQWRRTVRVQKVDDLASAGALDSIRLPVVPLRWRPDACDEVWLRATHDGTRIRIELEWADDTRDDRVRPDVRMGDGVAIQFASETEPPLFPMGTDAAPVNVWRWHTYDPKELAGMVDLMGQQPHQGLDVPWPIQVDPRAESVQFGGMHTVGRRAGAGLPIDADVQWRDGRWRATFERDLKARDDGEVDLSRGDAVLFAVAVWDGAIDEHPGSKAITTWHVLELLR